MRKITALIVVAALIISAPIAFAAEQKKVAEPTKAQPVQPPPMPGPGMQHQGMMMGPMPGMMRTTVRQMVASDDGGVIVTTGDKLIKYDKNLNVVKEVAISHEPPMRGMPMQGGQCPMCGQMMKGPEQPKEQK